MSHAPHPTPPLPSIATERMVIGVCTYNGAPRIRRTLEALVGMDLPPGRVSEVVVVDNRSSDATAETIDRFIASGPRIPVRRLYEGTPGKIAAMRRLFAETSEPLIALTDDDVAPEPDWARALLARFDEHPQAGVIGGPVSNIWEAGPTRLADLYRKSLGDYHREPVPHKLDGPRQFVIGASLALRRAALADSGWLDGCYLEARTGAKLECGAEDAEVCIRIRQAGWDVWYDPAVRVNHYIPETRQTMDYLQRLREGICRGEPKLKWLAAERPGLTWVSYHERRARLLWLKTLLFDWRPTRRRIRLAERLGRVDGWSTLKRELAGPGPTLTLPSPLNP